MEYGGASPKVLICVSRPRRKSKRMSVHRTYTWRVWNTLGCLQDSSDTWMYVRMYGIVINSEHTLMCQLNKPLKYHTLHANNTFRLKTLLRHLWQSFVENPYNFLATNSTIGYAIHILSLKKIIRLRRHYLPLVLRVVRPHWWKDARCWGNPRAAPSHVRTRWLEVSLLYFVDFLPDSRIFCVTVKSLRTNKMEFFLWS